MCCVPDLRTQGRIYKALRLRRGLKQRTLGHELGLHENEQQQTVSDVERGVHDVRRDQRTSWDKLLAVGDRRSGARLCYTLGLLDLVDPTKPKLELPPEPVRAFDDRAMAEAATILLIGLGFDCIGVVPIWSSAEALIVKDLDSAIYWFTVLEREWL